MTRKSMPLRVRLLTLVTALGSCGPEAAAPLDVDGIVEAYCEKASRCSLDPDFDAEYCRNFMKERGVRTGPGSFEERGCLDEELEYLECLTPMSCEEFQAWQQHMLPEVPCADEMQAVLDAGCLSVP